MFTFFDMRFERYMPSELIKCHNLEFGFEIKESIAHLTTEWNFGFVSNLEIEVLNFSLPSPPLPLF